jgi:sugar phosphate permease
MLRKHRVAASLFVVYASFYLCRANVDASFPLLSRAYGYDKEQLGRLSSIAILAYAAGKLMLGPIGDIVGGRRLLGLAVAGSVVASFALGASSSLAALTFFAAQNRYFQAGGWIGLIHVASREFAPREHGSMMGAVSTSYEIGNVVALLLCGALVALGFAWRVLFVVNPILFGLVGIAVATVLGRQTEPAAQVGSIGARGDDGETLWRRLTWLARLPSFWTALALSVLLTFVRTGFLTWTPTFLAELGSREGGGVSGAIVKSAIFPAAGVVGALSAGRASDRFGPGRRAPVVAVSLALLLGAILVLGHAAMGNVAAVAMIGACGLFLLGPYSLVGGAIALDVGKTRAASTAVGLLDAGGYLGASLAGVLLGALAQRHGWSAAFDALAVAVLAAAIVAVIWAFGAAAWARQRELV